MGKPAVTPESISGEALFLLRALRDGARAGKGNKLADVKAALEPAVSLEFDRYFFFLRKYQYVALDREAQLRLTEAGERAAAGGSHERLSGEVTDFFAPELGGVDVSQVLDEALLSARGAGGEPEGDEVTFTPPPMRFPPLLRAAASAPAEERAVPPGLTRTAPREVHAFPPPAPAPAEVEVPVPVATPVPGTVPVVAAAARAGGERSGGEVDGRYARLEPLGSGALASVTRARHLALGVEVALKELKDLFGLFSFLPRAEVLKRFKRELCAQAAVRHPCVVAVLDQQVEGARPYWVTELVATSLRERLGDGRALPVALALRAVAQLAHGLGAAHAAGLTHHNLKPENVLFDTAGNAKAGDFGLGRVVETDGARNGPSVLLGTGGLAYLAPELLVRQKDAGRAADVYALGILLYEMLAGRPPGRRSPLPGALNAEVPAGVDALFDRMTADEREARLPDMDAVLAELERAASGAPWLSADHVVLARGG